MQDGPPDARDHVGDPERHGALVLLDHPPEEEEIEHVARQMGPAGVAKAAGEELVPGHTVGAQIKPLDEGHVEDLHARMSAARV